jgi:hypothetical protein
MHSYHLWKLFIVILHKLKITKNRQSLRYAVTLEWRNMETGQFTEILILGDLQRIQKNELKIN